MGNVSLGALGNHFEDASLGLPWGLREIILEMLLGRWGIIWEMLLWGGKFGTDPAPDQPEPETAILEQILDQTSLKQEI